MSKRIPVLASVALVVAGLGVSTAAASEAPATVCATRCAYSTIQAAVTAAAPGATITVAPGTYTENVVIDKALTLQGAGEGTVVRPATSNPNCGGAGGGSLCAGGSNVVLVQASHVTIRDLRIDGDNPDLTSGVVAGGADIDARNGIITNHAAGRFDDLTVTGVRVSNIYLRGIYASSGGTFSFTHDRVDNVQADAASIGIFDFGGAGVIADNRVTSASDAIAANWSTGTRFVGNEVSRSGSGVHTDNNGGNGGTADVLQGNTVRDCTRDGYGVWVFAPFLSPSVQGNTVQGCYVGLGGFGSNVPGQGATFSGNRVEGDHAATSDPAGTYGAYLTTDELGWGHGDLTATLTGNRIEHTGTGLHVTEASGGNATVTAHGNSFHENGTGANGTTGTVVDATVNWWGCRQGPNSGHDCDTATGTVQFTPWLTSKP